MALDYALIVEASLAEVIVDVAGEDEVVPIHSFLTNLEHVFETLMRKFLPIDVVPMPVEKPKLMWILMEKSRVCSVGKTHVCLFEVRIGLPEALIATKNWQARVHANASPRSEEYRLAIKYATCCKINNMAVQNLFCRHFTINLLILTK